MVRKDIDYQVYHAPGPDLIVIASSNIQEALGVYWFVEEREASAIVYCQTKLDVVEVAKNLGCPYYYSDSGMDKEKAK
jgi:superfamily II DNA helicase RecQ